MWGRFSNLPKDRPFLARPKAMRSETPGRAGRVPGATDKLVCPCLGDPRQTQTPSNEFEGGTPRQTMYDVKRLETLGLTVAVQTVA